MKDMHSLVGKVGKCSRGKIGVITGKKELPWGISWIGYCIEDGSEWASREPEILADSVDEYKRIHR